MADLSIFDYVKVSVPIITATGGVVVAAVKYGLNGSKKQISEIHGTVIDIDKRLVRVETIIDPGRGQATASDRRVA